MKRQLAVFCLTATAVGLVLLPGCRSNSQPAPPPAVESTGNNTPPPTTTVAQPPTTNTATLSGSDIVATVNGWNITRQELEQPLIDAHGLTILLNLVQLNLAKQQTTKMGLHVSPEDVQRERQVTFNKLFPDATAGDDENLLDQFLRQQHSSRAEFDLTIETNAHLRKAAEVQLPGKITEEMMHSAFGQLYGENRQVRDIELGNMREVGAAQARLAKGEPFAQVAQEMSLDRRTAAVGGELPPFSAQSPNIPQAIKDIAQTLKQGQVSPDAVVVESKYHLIKLERIIPPKVVKYEDVKDSVRKTLEEQWIEFAMREYRNQLAQVAVQTMNIRDPVLAEQWKRQLAQKQSSIKDRDSALAEINRQREAAAAAAATQPSATATTTQPTTPTTVPPAAIGQPPDVERPPATKPGAAVPPAPGTSSVLTVPTTQK